MASRKEAFGESTSGTCLRKAHHERPNNRQRPTGSPTGSCETERHPHARGRAGRGAAGRAAATASRSPGTPGATSSRRWPRPATTRSRPTCAATARPTARTAIEQYTHAAPRRRHGRPARRARRGAGGDRRPRLGRAGRLEHRAAASRPLPRGRRAERAVPAARLGARRPRLPQTARRGLLPALLPGARRGRGGAGARRARQPSSASSTGASGDCAAGRSGPTLPHGSRKGGALFDHMPSPSSPAWLTEADIEFYAAEFARTGFRGRPELVPQHRPELGADGAVPGCAADSSGAVRARRPGRQRHAAAAWTSSSPTWRTSCRT